MSSFGSCGKLQPRKTNCNFLNSVRYISVTNKKDIMNIEDLYNGTATIEVKFKEKALAFSVEVFDRIAKVYGDRFEADCKIGHFGYNQYFRTNFGAYSKKYKSIGNLKQAITLSARSRGLTVEKFILAPTNL
jgi:hypothetical protein